MGNIVFWLGQVSMFFGLVGIPGLFIVRVVRWHLEFDRINKADGGTK